jgi:hypothetical protein
MHKEEWTGDVVVPADPDPSLEALSASFTGLRFGRIRFECVRGGAGESLLMLKKLD